MKHPVSATLLVVLVSVGSAAAQPAKRAITHEDVWLMQRLGAPALSPDGKWVAVAVTEPAYDDKQSSDLWLVPADGSAQPRRLTHTKTAEGGIAWSPDSTRLAFSARRDGDEAAQIYVLDLARGGESRRVTSAVTGARAAVWRPDGNAILFTSDVYPGAKTDADNRAADAERKARTWNARVFDGFPIRMWDRWLDERRPSLFLQPLDPGARRETCSLGPSSSRAPASEAGSGPRARKSTRPGPPTAAVWRLPPRPRGTRRRTPRFAVRCGSCRPPGASQNG